MPVRRYPWRLAFSLAMLSTLAPSFAQEGVAPTRAPAKTSLPRGESYTVEIIDDEGPNVSPKSYPAKRAADSVTPTKSAPRNKANVVSGPRSTFAIQEGPSSSSPKQSRSTSAVTPAGYGQRQLETVFDPRTAMRAAPAQPAGPSMNDLVVPPNPSPMLARPVGSGLNARTRPVKSVDSLGAKSLLIAGDSGKSKAPKTLLDRVIPDPTAALVGIGIGKGAPTPAPIQREQRLPPDSDGLQAIPVDFKTGKTRDGGAPVDSAPASGSIQGELRLPPQADELPLIPVDFQTDQPQDSRATAASAPALPELPRRIVEQPVVPAAGQPIPIAKPSEATEKVEEFTDLEPSLPGIFLPVESDTPAPQVLPPRRFDPPTRWTSAQDDSSSSPPAMRKSTASPEAPLRLVPPPATKSQSGPSLGAQTAQQPGPPTQGEAAPTPGANPAPPRTAASLDRDIMLQAARNAVSLGDLALATERFETYLRIYPDDVVARAEYAGVLVQRFLLNEAIDQFQMLIAQEPENLKLRQQLADVYTQAKDYPNAIAQFNLILEREPGNVDVATRLARVYVFNENMEEATRIYDRYLRTLAPSDAKAPKVLGNLLLEIERTREAIPYLEQTYKSDPNDLETLANLIRAYALLGNQPKMLEMIAELGNKPIDNAIRINLAGDLWVYNHFDGAQLVYAQVLATDPDNGAALLGTARIHLGLFAPQQAITILRNPASWATDKHAYLQVLASYHTQLGEYADSKLIYRDLLTRNPNDDSTRLALAALYEFTREFERAKGEYGKIPADSTQRYQARIGIASVLSAQRKFDEANALACELAAERPRRSEPVVQLVRNLTELKDFDRGEAIAREFLEKNTTESQAIIDVRLALARLLLKAQKPLEASREYEKILRLPGGNVPAAQYGLYMATMKLGNADAAEAALQTYIANSGDMRARILLTDLFLEAGEFSHAIRVLDQALRLDPSLVPALNRLGEAQSGLQMRSMEEPAIITFQQALSISGTDIRARLGLARMYARQQLFDESIAQYDMLVAMDSSNLTIKRERARVFFQEGGYERAEFAYQQIQVPSADQQLKDDLDAFVKQHAQNDRELGLILRADLNGQALLAEVGKAATTEQRNSPQVLALQRLLVDYETLATEQANAFTEADAKCKRYWRNEEAIPIYLGLEASEPWNEEAYFDLGQTYNELLRTRDALGQYSDLLDINPQHREGAIAAERSSLALNTQLRGQYRYFGQTGRGGLAQIQKHYFTVDAQMHHIDENEFIGVGYTSALYLPELDDDRPLSGNIYMFDVQRKWDEDTLLYLSLDVEEYQTRLNTRPTFNMGVNHRASDYFRLLVDLYLENVIENGETLRQDIFRGGASIAATIKPDRRCDAGGRYRLSFYSDNNTLHEASLFASYDVTLPPTLFRVMLSGDFMGYTQQTIFSPDPFNPIPNSVHPYFAPSAYLFGTAWFQWYHWLSRDYFQKANQTWYSVQYGPRLDSQGVYFHNFRAILHHDFTSNLSSEIEVGILQSKVYSATTASVWLIYRLPCL